MKKIEVGWIQNTHGIKGELKVRSSTDFPDIHFQVGKKLYLEESSLDLEIKSCRQQKNLYLLQFKNFENINLVKNWLNKKLFIDKKDQVVLPKGEYYRQELIGLEVIDEENKMIGYVVAVEETLGAQNNLRIQLENKQILFPYVKDFIWRVELEKKRIYVRKIGQFL